LENQGLNGFFDPKDEKKWEGQARKILSTIVNSTDMLICAEDLGVIPKACPKVMEELGIPGNDVQRWVKDWNIKHDFLSPGEYRQFSVAMLSTHDTTNWKVWWQYEAGTVDEDLFVRKCRDRQIDFSRVRLELFDLNLSFHGRMRWKKEIDCIDRLLCVLGRKKEEVKDFIELYENSYCEKEKLWKLLACPGPVTEEASNELLARIIQFTLNSRAIFCIHSIIDLLGLSGVFKGDPYQYRVNVPGIISPKNWSLRLPISLEELLSHPVNQQIRKMVVDSGRI
jgi:4-alpha-glucanotransferase